MAMAPSSSLPQVYPSHVVVAVWEWQDGLGIWHPYSATVCSFIEQHFVRQRGQHFGLGSLAHSIPLGQADPSLAPYIIDLPSWTQFRQNTGTMRSVRRHLFSQNSAPGQGIVWEWLGDDGSWVAYEARICDYLEQQVARGIQVVDLAPLGYNYTVNYATLTQTNKTSSFCRSVRRQVGPVYPVTSDIAVPRQMGLICFCQQCLHGSGTGPVSGRYRHSMTNLPAYPAPQAPHRTTTVSGAHQAFAPYNKPSLSGARSAPRLNTTNPWAAAPPVAGNQSLFHSSLSHLGPQLLPSGPSTSSGASASFPSGPSSSSPGSAPTTVPVQMPKASRVQQALAGMTSVLSAIGLPVCLSRAPRPTGPPASRPASKSHSSVKRLRKMSVKGSCGSHTLSALLSFLHTLLPGLSSLPTVRDPFLLHLFSLPCLPAQVATGIFLSALLGDGLITQDNFAVLVQIETLLSLQGASPTLNFDHLAGISHHVRFM